MSNIISPFLLAVLNLIYAIVIYLSLRGWLVIYEPSGMQLLVHVIITFPITIISTIWFFYLSRQKLITHIAWKVNLIGVLIPLMSIQTGVTYYYYDLIGLFIAVCTLVILIFLMYKEINIKFANQRQERIKL